MENIQLFRSILCVLSLCLLSSLCYAQVSEQWVKRYNGPENGNDLVRDLAVDGLGNVYVTGESGKTDNTFIINLDILTIKYDAAGNVLWTRTYDGPGGEGFDSDGSSSVAVDTAGNVYVTGTINSAGDNDFDVDIVTIKYDPAGNELWVKLFKNDPEMVDDVPLSLTVDASGNIYIVGSSAVNFYNLDFLIIKYDTNGNELWARTYNSMGNYYDIAKDLELDALGNVYVTGTSTVECQVFCEDCSPVCKDIYTTIKYDKNGDELWVKTYNGPDGNANASSLAVDASGNIYVTGSSNVSVNNTDYTTIKYDASGNELWVKRYNGPGNGIDEGNSIAVSPNGNVYVTGNSTGSGTGIDFATVKYDAAGNEQWVKSYNGLGNGGEFARSIAVSPNGNVYVTGNSTGSGTGIDFATVKYDAAGNEQWVKSYNGPGNGIDALISFAIDVLGNVYVTGQSNGNGTGFDFTTIKYTQTEGMAVSSYTLVNADTDQDIGELKDGAIIDLSKLPNTRLNIRANTNPSVVGSVVFDLSWGGQVVHRADNTDPYAFIRYDIDNTPQDKNDYHGVIPALGDYTLTATPYSGPDGSGQKGTAYTIHFKVVNTTPTTNNTKRAEVSQLMEVSKRFRVSVAPNPVSTFARLQYELPEDGEVTIKVYDVVGREVTTVVQAERKAGMYYGNLNASDLAKGVYYYHALFTTTQKKVYIQTGKIVVIK